MQPIILKIVDNDYTDFFEEESEPIEKLINYIYRIKEGINLPIYCYGVDLNYIAPFDNDYYFELLYKLKETFIYTAPYILGSSDISPNLLHLVLSLPSSTILYNYIFMIDSIARLFANEYPVCYSIHNDTGHLHVHYAICTRSYTDSHNALRKDKLDTYIKKIRSIIKSYYCKFLLIKEDKCYV